MHVIWSIVIGFFAGALAKLIMPGKDPGGFIITTLLGIAGSVLARYLGLAMGLYQSTDSAGFIASVVGALIILAIYHFFTRRRARMP